MDYNILLMILPPHFSHLTQSLDVEIFGTLKKHMATELESLVRTDIARIQKMKWLTTFVGVYDKAVNVKNIFSGFRGIGIHPFLPTKVLRRVISLSLSQSQNRSSTSFNPITSFNEAVLIDSPIDFNAVQQANVALNTLLGSNNPLPISAKKYVRHLTRFVMRLHARNIIVE